MKRSSSISKKNWRKECRSGYSRFRSARSVPLPGLPVVSGRDLIKVLSRLGYQVVRQRGSHARLKCTTSSGEHAITIPLHEEIAPDTL
ncbi:MAG TPA: type II toxin-antitoxin system HicA family toxin [Methanoregulaceae archaeon]|nr:type II toxin-antitoxin system HicA family toxin [Methanoregulaceae archaeon]